MSGESENARSRTAALGTALKADRYTNEKQPAPRPRDRERDRGVKRHREQQDFRPHRGDHRGPVFRGDFRGDFRGGLRGRGRGRGFGFGPPRGFGRHGPGGYRHHGPQWQHRGRQGAGPAYEEEGKDDSLLGKLRKDIRCCWDEDKSIVVFYGDLIVLHVLDDGRFEISCPLDKRDENTACAISAVLRPFNLQVVPLDENDYSSQWYLSDKKNYKVKCLENSVVSGPASQVESMPNRTKLIAELIEAGALFVKAASSIRFAGDERKTVASHAMEISDGVSVGDMKVLSPVQALYDYCKEKSWATDGLFWFDRSRRNGIDGYNWTVRILQYDVSIGPSDHTWNPDKIVAKNLAAENALNAIRALSA